MNHVLHDYLNKLRIISQLRAGQRLDTKNGLTIYEEGWWAWSLRKYYHDNKDETVRVLQDLFRAIDQTVEQLLADITSVSNAVVKSRKIEVSVNLAEKLRSAIAGIENLSRTYASFPRTTAMLEGIVQDFAIPTYKQLVEIIPAEKYTKTLRKNIVYNEAVLYLGRDSLVDPQEGDDAEK